VSNKHGPFENTNARIVAHSQIGYSLINLNSNNYC
jgi:hypothetical protein